MDRGRSRDGIRDDYSLLLCCHHAALFLSQGRKMMVMGNFKCSLEIVVLCACVSLSLRLCI